MNNDMDNAENTNLDSTIAALIEAESAIAIPAGEYYVTRTVDMLDEMGRWSTQGWGDPNVQYSKENGWTGTVLLDDGTTISAQDYGRYNDLMNDSTNFSGDDNGFGYGIGIRNSEYFAPKDLDFLLAHRLIKPLTVEIPFTLLDLDKIDQETLDALNITDEELIYVMLYTDGTVRDSQELL